MIYGKRLQAGDTVGLIAPSGAIRTPGALERAIRETERMGFRVKAGASCGGAYGYLAGTDEARARDFNEMFLDDEVDAVFCVKGGYGAMRILDMIDYEAVAAHPKIFAGYSDVTALHAALLKKCGLVTFHAPMPVSCWADGALDAVSAESMRAALMSTQPVGPVVNPPQFARECLVEGVCEGRLVGGNLTLMAHLLGTPYAFDVKDNILFIEDVGEYTYSIDRMLTHMRLAGVFDACAGVIFGDFRRCETEYPDFGFTLREVIEDVVVPCGRPVFMGLQSGHCTPKLTLPLGAMCRMDASACTLTVLEGAVV